MKKLLIILLLIVGCEEALEPIIEGCTTSTGCNYNTDATKDDGSCTYAVNNYDCNGECILNIDCLLIGAWEFIPNEEDEVQWTETLTFDSDGTYTIVGEDNNMLQFGIWTTNVSNQLMLTPSTSTTWNTVDYSISENILTLVFSDTIEVRYQKAGTS